MITNLDVESFNINIADYPTVSVWDRVKAAWKILWEVESRAYGVRVYATLTDGFRLAVPGVWSHQTYVHNTGDQACRFTQELVTNIILCVNDAAEEHLKLGVYAAD